MVALVRQVSPHTLAGPVERDERFARRNHARLAQGGAAAGVEAEFHPVGNDTWPLDPLGPRHQTLPLRAKTVSLTEDGRYVVIDGRRWRASDPSLTEEHRKELVRALMAARRAVRDAKQAGDDAAMAQARARVHEAKVALGERGPPWWDRSESG